MKPGKAYRFAEGVTGTVVQDPTPRRRLALPCGGAGDRILRFDPPIDEAYLERTRPRPAAALHPPAGHARRRRSATRPSSRGRTGSAAAPTAGLHFTPGLLGGAFGRGACRSRTSRCTSGLGTFLPIRSRGHRGPRMHEEAYTDLRRGRRPRWRRRRPRAGRCWRWAPRWCARWRSAWDGAGLREGEGSTRLYITPGYRFRVVDQLFTNFHTPGSSLLVLVSAFAGRDAILAAYAEAVAKRYRFFSYGDAMLIADQTVELAGRGRRPMVSTSCLRPSSAKVARTLARRASCSSMISW